MVNRLSSEFRNIFRQEHTHLFFAPGRINLIGEHIDYNGGLVLPCAISQGTYVLLAPNKLEKFRLRSLNFPEEADLDIAEQFVKKDNSWFYYPLGLIDRFIKKGFRPGGLDMLFFGNLPIGAGLSSSASIEVATAFALNELLHAGLSRLRLVTLSKEVENNFIGVSSGIMDQFAVAFGEKNKALKLNCDTLDYERVDCNTGNYLLAIINTNKPRRLAESKYNERVSECAQALEALNSRLNIRNLCELDTEAFDSHEYLITDPAVRNRARHVIEENGRVNDAARELAAGNTAEFGRLMYASHNSLKNLYEVSGTELDTIVDYCLKNQDVAGARMTGAGFGGCAIALVRKEGFDRFSKEISDYYTPRIGYPPSVYSSLVDEGVRALDHL